jgi:hypothetical protein
VAQRQIANQTLDLVKFEMISLRHLIGWFVDWQIRSHKLDQLDQQSAENHLQVVRHVEGFFFFNCDLRVFSPAVFNIKK